MTRNIVMRLCLTVAAAAALPRVGSAQAIPAGISVREGNVDVFAYGRGQPTLVCAEMHVCVIELQTGEQVTEKPIIADDQSWSATVYAVGAGAEQRSEVAIKPLLCGVSTNMVLPTSRRRYELSLLSAPCRAVDDWDHNAAYTRRVRFSYPDDAAWLAAQQQPAQQAAPLPSNAAATHTGYAASLALQTGVDVEALRFDYTWRRTNGFPWEPLQVFDDGVHIYIRVPPEARGYEQPILFVVEESGSRTLLNYAPPAEGDYFRTDRVVGHLALVIGSARRGGRPKVLHITNRRLSGGK